MGLSEQLFLMLDARGIKRLDAFPSENGRMVYVCTFQEENRFRSIIYPTPNGEERFQSWELGEGVATIEEAHQVHESLINLVKAGEIPLNQKFEGGSLVVTGMRGPYMDVWVEPERIELATV